MGHQIVDASRPQPAGLSQWRAMLMDQPALLTQPGAHHKTLLAWAYAMHRDKVIDSDELSELLELADGALAFAVEAVLDIDSDE
ncbi:hypothetical protein [Pseudomonas sp. PS01299]|uniref:hypothetical protein n=1 Tax=Pseudomonas sp. PS01299 TaxID=2991435 RepID=UPI00249C6C14|nr:hypothetical protein [Pseudomonas sp. PS01299]